MTLLVFPRPQKHLGLFGLDKRCNDKVVVPFRIEVDCHFSLSGSFKSYKYII